MIVDHINARHIGPFLRPFSLDFDPRVTVLTGSNDVGKSSVLDLIQFVFGDGSISQDQVNHDYLQKVGGEWTKDQTLLVEAKLRLTLESDITRQIPISEGDSVTIKRCLASEINSVQSVVKISSNLGGATIKPILPKVIRPQLKGGLRDEIDLRQPKPLEQALLNAAFGEEFVFSKYLALSDLHFTRALLRAKSSLNQLLERVLPMPGMIKVDLLPIAGERHRLALMLRDRHDGITPFGLRGEGVKRMITLLAELITTDRSANHRIILLDEPENSLHADAQHLLREFLWELTSNGRCQVVYATHSPCMINPIRPEQVRLLVREKIGDTATTKLVRRSAAENYAGVRTALGISAADSLLYAPVTIVTEGETEVRCILPLVLKLIAAGIEDLDDAEKLLGLCTFLDGMGDSFELLCRLAKSHGTQVVLFLDGDKRKRVADLKIVETYPDVPIIFTPGTTEFEELVPAEDYFRAIFELVDIGTPIGEAVSSFANWTDADPRRSKRAFSKRVEEWFRSFYDEAFPAKPAVMKKAIESVEAKSINAEPIKALLGGVRKVLDGSSFL